MAFFFWETFIPSPNDQIKGNSIFVRLVLHFLLFNDCACFLPFLLWVWFLHSLVDFASFISAFVRPQLPLITSPADRVSPYIIFFKNVIKTAIKVSKHVARAKIRRLISVCCKMSRHPSTSHLIFFWERQSCLTKQLNQQFVSFLFLSRVRLQPETTACNNSLCVSNGSFQLPWPLFFWGLLP